MTTLTEDFENKGYTVYTDNYYSGPILCKSLLEKGIYFSGTASTTRTISQESFSVYMNEETISFATMNILQQSNDMTEGKFVLCSLFYSDELTAILRRGSESGD